MSVATEEVQNWLESYKRNPGCHAMTKSKIAEEISTVTEQRNSNDEMV